MAQKPSRPTPPYATFQTFLNFLNKLRDTVVPRRIDNTVFGNASGSLIYSIIASLKGLDLIDENGAPRPALSQLVKASDEDRKPLIGKLLRTAYPSLWGPGVDLENMSAGQFDEHLRDEHQISGSTIDKAAAFFIAAANFSGVPISPHLKARKPIATSPASRKSAKQRKKSEGDAEETEAPDDPRPPFRQHEAGKPLEYQLIDLMSEPDIEPQVKESIWALVQYLTARKVKSSAQEE